MNKEKDNELSNQGNSVPERITDSFRDEIQIDEQFYQTDRDITSMFKIGIKE
ncbi:hypothetical protein XBJ1_0245 [Xenorhabdus bovienii SS-2004]|uniref:Uncharacterized protein n=1 Tax=Xenorhabdus bovienii (strain SS-2004) TaxID=406818 RepID=D3UYL8_XENBS|nr:hypothetical protein [Xenorhabdus bovienii]CBJ79396.1 hypothetical protein XBJ1_0245 [Xenorhabdus bovienii SS-2004]